MIATLLTAGYILVTGLYLYSVRAARTGSPTYWYAVALALMAIGTFVQLDIGRASDGTYAVAIFLSVFCYSAVGIIMHYALHIKQSVAIYKSKRYIGSNTPTRFFVFVLFAISVAVTIIYYAATGVNMTSAIISSSVEGDYSTARLSGYAGVNYYAAGYVNQFKNVFLPLTSTIILYWTFYSHRRYFWPLLAGLVILNLYALLGTGQRTYLVFAAGASVFGFVLHFQGTSLKLFNKATLAAILAVSLLFVLTTGVYQGGSGGFGESLTLSLRRIFYAQQWAGVEAFRYIYSKPIVWFAEWKDSMLGILPGNRGSTLANEIHDIMFSSIRGTAPPTVVGSAYHNGGLILVAAFFGFLAIFYSLFYKMFLSGPRTICRSMTYGAIFFYMTSYFVGSPKYLFDNGVVALIILLIGFRMLRSKQASRRMVTIRLNQ